MGGADYCGHGEDGVDHHNGDDHDGDHHDSDYHNSDHHDVVDGD